MQNTGPFHRRTAFSLLELVVVLFSVGILLALLIPAVVDFRGPVRSSQCSTNLRNLALASIQYENSKGQFPGWAMDFGYYGWDPDTQSMFRSSNAPSDVSADSKSPTAHRKIGTWAVAILPWLDAQPTYEHWTEDRYPIVTLDLPEFPASSGISGEGFHPLAAPNLAIMQCPSDPTPIADYGNNNYIINAGIAIDSSLASDTGRIVYQPNGDRRQITFTDSMTVKWGVSGNQVVALRDARSDELVPTGPPICLADFRDGPGNTVLFSESLHAMPWHRSGFTSRVDLVFEHHPDEVVYPTKSRFTNAFVWHSVDWENAGQPLDVHRINGAGASKDSIEITPSNAADFARPSSAHVEGVNAAMADGTTRFISDSIDMWVWQAMMTPAGEDTAPADLH